MKKFILLLAIALFGMPLVSQNLVAGNSGPADKDPDTTKWHLTTVKWIKGTHNALEYDDRYAVLIGKVVKKIDGDTYLLDDDTGIIELDSDLELPVGKYIVVRGLISQAWLNAGFSDYGNVDIEVKSWRYDKDVPK